MVDPLDLNFHASRLSAMDSLIIEKILDSEPKNTKTNLNRFLAGTKSYPKSLFSMEQKTSRDSISDESLRVVSSKRNSSDAET